MKHGDEMVRVQIKPGDEMVRVEVTWFGWR